VKIKDKDPNPDSESDSKNTSRRQIINEHPTAIVMTPTIQQKNLHILRRGSSFFIHKYG
jgi:hypothetical protein